LCFIWKLTQLAAQLLFTLSVFKLSCFFCNINIYYPKYWSEIYFSTCFYSNISKFKTYYFQMTMISWVTTSVGGKRNADFSQFSRESKSPSCRVEAKKHTDFSTKTTTTTAATKEQSKVSFRRMSDLYRDQKTVRMVSTSA
jgi:hypothetical protein